MDAERRQRVDEHLRACEACRAEADLVLAVRSGRPEPPPELWDRIEHSIDHELSRPTFGRRRAPRWTWAAAAGLVVALGTGVIWNQVQNGGVQVAADELEPIPESWLIDDAVVAGAVVLDDLSDEDLAALLEEVGG